MPQPQNSLGALREEFFTEAALRPASFEEYIGQETVKQNVQLMIRAAQKRSEPIDHLLLYGQAGLGKTTLATIIARSLGARLKITSGPVLERIGDMAAILSSLEAGDVLFIDEAHRINAAIEEILYPAMETRQLHLVIGKGPSARAMTLDLEPFTLIAATTRVNLLSSPLRSRFGAVLKLDYYRRTDIEKIIQRSAAILDVDVTQKGRAVIAAASRFTPRTANRLLKRVRDVCSVENQNTVDESLARRALAMFSIDEAGLEEYDRRLLEVLVEKFGGGPVGLSTLAAALDEDKGTIEDVYEPYLIKMGFITRTPQGRKATERARKHLEHTNKGAGNKK
jgi:Holliday junction DNA helicase RuvB